MKKNFIISVLLLFISVIYVILVKTVDVSNIGPNESSVGFASLNSFFISLTGENLTWYKVTEILGIIPIFMAFVYALIGLKQLFQRKSLLKVDKELLGLGVFYISVIFVYIFFEIFIINYRPVLMDGELEASFPSSHTMMALCLCGSAILLNKKLFNKIPVVKIVNPILIIVMVVLILGRFLSGVHWFSDILGGIIISSTLVMFYYTFLNYNKKND